MRQEYGVSVPELEQPSSRKPKQVGDERGADGISSLAFNAQFGKAAGLARAGRYGEAEALLGSMDPDLGNPVILDLRARICAQQGQLNQAEVYWRRAIEQNPGHRDYAKGLARISALQRKPVVLLFLWPVLLIAGAALLLLISLPRFMGSKTSDLFKPGLEMLNRIENQQNKLASQIQTIQKNVNAFSEPLQQLQGDIAVLNGKKEANKGQDSVLSAIHFNIPGLSIRQNKTDLELVFETGLFSDGTVLSRAGRSRLTALGKVLEAHTADIKVHVVGHTDDRTLSPGAMYNDNVDLGLERAAAVVSFLRRNSLLPFHLFSLTSGGEFDPPFPNDSRENQARNRTVTIQLIPRR